MKEENPLVNKEYLLEKFPGKGGWTYALIPEIPLSKTAPFGWVKVSGFIDNYELKRHTLMPMGGGKLFLTVKAEIRKKIGKKEGDRVKIVLYNDVTPLEIPEELMECFKYEPPEALHNFLGFTQSEQSAYLEWIYSAKTDETKADRIVKMMDRLVLNMRLYD